MCNFADVVATKFKENGMKKNYVSIMFSLISMSLIPMSLAVMLISSCTDQPAASTRLRDQTEAFHEVMEEVIDAGRVADLETINKLLPAMQAYADSIMAAEVPEDLMKNQTVIATTAADLKAAVVDFEKYGVAHTVADSIMKALHPVRLAHNRLEAQLRVSVPELQAFHAVMHSVWHSAVPNGEWEKVKAVVPQFVEKSAALDNIQWPRELGQRIPTLKTKTVELQEIVTELAAADKSNDNAAFKSAMIKIHEKYVEIKTLL